MFIYLITNIKNKKRYVGQTATSLENRFKQHCQKGGILTDAIKKYGKDNFKIELIASVTNRKLLDIFEIAAIKKLKTVAPNGYNLRDGGLSGFSPNKQTREKLRNANIGKPTGRHIDFTGKKVGNLTVLSVVNGVTGINYKTWNVQCSCGSIETRTTRALSRKQFHACSDCIKEHYSKLWVKDIVGATFHNLSVIKKVESIKKKALFLCKCSCGNELVCRGVDLRSGAKKKCTRYCNGQ